MSVSGEFFKTFREKSAFIDDYFHQIIYMSDKGVEGQRDKMIETIEKLIDECVEYGYMMNEICSEYSKGARKDE